MNLFKIANEYRFLAHTLIDDETGAINEEALTCLAIAESNVKEKAIAVASFIKNIDAERNAIDEAKKAMHEREVRLNKQINYLTDYLKDNMEACEITEITCPYFDIKIKKNPISVDVQDEALIPMEYKKVKEVVSIDKVKIKEEILAGVVVPGAALKQNTRLDIK